MSEGTLSPSIPPSNESSELTHSGGDNRVSQMSPLGQVPSALHGAPDGGDGLKHPLAARLTPRKSATRPRTF